MKTKVINSMLSQVLNPEDNTLIIRITSNEEFAQLNYRESFQDILELRFDDVSDTHPKNDKMRYGAMKKEDFWSIVEFINKNKDTAKTLIINCDAGQSRSPAVATGILDYLLEDPQQSIELIKKNTNWKPNSFVTSFFRTAYFNREI
jgi:predicted protein tyrosine phosphatase